MAHDLSARQLRSQLFHHLDGLVVLPTLAAMQHRGVHVHLLDKGLVDVDALAERFEGNAGYLNVALRLLASQGWLEQQIEEGRTRYKVLPEATPILEAARCWDTIPQLIDELIAMPAVLGDARRAAQLAKLHATLREAVARRALPPGTQDRLLGMVEGLLAGPLLVHLAMHGARHKMDNRGRDRLANLAAPHRQGAETLLEHLGWCEALEIEAPVLGRQAAFYAARASAYGVTVSYLHTMARLDRLLFGAGDVLWTIPSGSPEIHVDRTMNVWGSGGAHGAYFKRVDELVMDLFNRPLDEQPLGFADMGSGDGTLIAHLFDLVHDHTLRGEHLKEHPLLIVGADYNEAARASTRATLARADVWGEVLFGDVSDPDRLAADLREKHHADLGDLLNLRTFIDHNRMYKAPAAFDTGRQARSTGAFAFRGARLGNAAVEQDLCEHLRRWAPYLERFGLIVIELHTLPPAVAAAHQGITAVTAYDGTHGYSDQYIVEHDVFLEVAAQAGLYPIEAAGKVYPSAELPVISVNWLRS